MGDSSDCWLKLKKRTIMLRFSTTTPFCVHDPLSTLLNTHPLIVPPKDCHLRNGEIKGNNAYIVGEALALAGFHLPCFFDGDITELDNPDGKIFMVLPSGTYRVHAHLDAENNYLLDLA